jgi:ribosomal protein S3
MGQKVNPISLRLEQTNRHFDSCWFNDYNYTNVLNRDIKIQSYINLILKQIKYSSARFFIQNLPNKIKINVFFLNPKNLRKSTSRVFQLKESPNVSQRKGQIGKKNKKIRATRFELVKKNCFLKHYKKQPISKAKLLNYLLINSTNTVSLVPRYLVGHDQGSSDSKKLNLRNPLPVALPVTARVTLVGKINNSSYTKNKVNLFLRYLLLKNFSLKSIVRFPVLTMKQTQSFLFYNLINFKLLNNNNKLVLTTNFLKTKIYDHEKSLKENISKNNLKFSSVSQKNYWKNPSFILDTLSVALPVTARVQSDEKSIALHHGNALSIKRKVETTKLGLLDLLCSQNINSNSLFLNTINNGSEKKDYIFSSLINNQSLKKTHNNYNKVFKNFSNLTVSNSPSQILEVSPESGKPGLCLAQTLAIAKKTKVPLVPNKVWNKDACTLAVTGRATGEAAGALVQKEQSTLESYQINNKKILLLRNSSYKKHLESQLSNVFFSNVVVSFSRFSNEKQSAIFLAEEIIYYLEKRVPFFKIKNQILREITKNSFLKGLRITCSGRVGGRSKKAQRSKVQIIKYGQTSLHVFSSKIDFASKHAHTAFGLLGIKVWICYN